MQSLVDLKYSIIGRMAELREMVSNSLDPTEIERIDQDLKGLDLMVESLNAQLAGFQIN